MTTKYLYPGESVTYTNTTASVIASGTVLIMGNIIGVALGDIYPNAYGTVGIKGVYALSKAPGNAWPQGARLLWDSSASRFDIGTAAAASGDVSNCCVAAEAATAAATTGAVMLNVGVGIVT